ncbi:MAG: outer membrane protein assembly factor BamD [Candidatus Eisenbacteria bacterium]|nr:outer membrane protein assembly factor BamD [Candidatus Eisenbacteria bacterium]
MHKRLFACLFSFGFAASFVLSCATTDGARPTVAVTQFEKAKARYEAHRYAEAAEQFKILLAQFPGSKYVEPATFFLGKSYFGSKEYPLAQVEFERVTRDYPRGSYAEEATFMLGVCAYKERRPAPYDQTSTDKAIALLEAYIAFYPEGAFVTQAQQEIRECQSILAQKLYLNGRLYLKLGDSVAARSCFDEVLAKYADSSWTQWASLGIAQSYERERNWEKAVEGYENVVNGDKNPETSNVAKDRLKKIRGKAKRAG